MTDEVNSLEEKDSKEGLQRLLDTSYPLLQKFRDTCPGTYKHSQALSSIVEGIAITLGLDVIKLKIAAQYHDVGKMFCPKYFTENQLEDDNPHDKLSPLMSYSIITRHVSDSVVILINDRNFPRDIIEIISQHHGQSVVRYFFEKSGTDVEDVFRYKTAKPTCIESAILMVCDHVEATSRSLAQADKLGDPQAVIERVINHLIDDSQLDDVYLRLGDLKKMKIALSKELEGTFQKRIDYGTVKEEVKEVGVE